MRMWKGVAGLGVTIVASVVLILLGILYYMLSIWIVKIGAGWAGLKDLSTNTIVLTAGIITAASMLGSTMGRQ